MNVVVMLVSLTVSNMLIKPFFLIISDHTFMDV